MFNKGSESKHFYLAPHLAKIQFFFSSQELQYCHLYHLTYRQFQQYAIHLRGSHSVVKKREKDGPRRVKYQSGACRRIIWKKFM